MNKKEVARKMQSYSFLTKEGNRVDAKGGHTREAYKNARSAAKHYSKNSIMGKQKLSGTYFKYDKEGIHDNYGPYYSHRPSKFSKSKE